LPRAHDVGGTPTPAERRELDPTRPRSALGVFGDVRDQLMQLPDPGQPVGPPPRRQPFDDLVHRISIVMLPAEVSPRKILITALLNSAVSQPVSTPRKPRGLLGRPEISFGDGLLENRSARPAKGIIEMLMRVGTRV
jgi:hypothetical protein